MNNALAHTREYCPLCGKTVSLYATGRLYRHKNVYDLDVCEGSGHIVAQAQALLIASDPPYVPRQPQPCCGQAPKVDIFILDAGTDRVYWTVLCLLCKRKAQAKHWDHTMIQWNKAET